MCAVGISNGFLLEMIIVLRWSRVGEWATWRPPLLAAYVVANVNLPSFRQSPPIIFELREVRRWRSLRWAQELIRVP